MIKVSAAREAIVTVVGGDKVRAVINIEDMHDTGAVIDLVDDAMGAASRTFSMRITCLATAVTGGAVRLSSLWSLRRGRSPRSGAGLAVRRTGWCRARGCSTGSVGRPG